MNACQFNKFFNYCALIVNNSNQNGGKPRSTLDGLAFGLPAKGRMLDGIGPSA
jgi:hypothetical protein